MPDEQPFPWVPGEAKAVARTHREWQAFKAASPASAAAAMGDGAPRLPTPFTYVILTSAASVVIGSGGAWQWKYTGNVAAFPLAHKLSPAVASVGTGVKILNTCEFANTSTKIMGIDVFAAGSSKCGDVVGCKPLTANFLNVPLPAFLFWAYFESGDPTDGYWAWHVTMTNELIRNEDPTDSTR